MIDEVCTEPSYLQTFTTDNETTLSHNIDLHMSMHDIFYTTHNCNSDSYHSLYPANFFTACLWLQCIVPAWYFYGFFFAFGDNKPSFSPLTNLQKLSLLSASGSRCVVKSGKWSSGSDHSKIKVHICTNRSVRNIRHHIITSSHSTHARHRARATFPPRGGALPPLPPLLHVLLARVCCSNCGRLLWSLVHVAVHFRLFRERYSPATQQRSPWTLTTVQ